MIFDEIVENTTEIFFDWFKALPSNHECFGWLLDGFLGVRDEYEEHDYCRKILLNFWNWYATQEID